MYKILFEYTDSANQYSIESAWAEKIGDHYKLDNILFYANEYSLGDLVSVEDRNGELYVKGLIEESGHSTVRILFNDKLDVQSTRLKLNKMGCESELSNIPILISVDIPKDIDYFGEIKPFLEDGLKKGIWGYEEACIAHLK